VVRSPRPTFIFDLSSLRWPDGSVRRAFLFAPVENGLRSTGGKLAGSHPSKLSGIIFTPSRRGRGGSRQKRRPRDERSRNGIVHHASGSPVDWHRKGRCKPACDAPARWGQAHRRATGTLANSAAWREKIEKSTSRFKPAISSQFHFGVHTGISTPIFRALFPTNHGT
jgi:hypothetical protein